MSRPRLVIFLLSFCTGLLVGELWHVPMMPLAAVAASGIACLSGRRSRWVSIILLGGVFGIWRMGTATAVVPNDISRFVGQTFEVAGDVLLPTTINGASQKLELVNVSSGKTFFIGKVLVSIPAIPTIPTGTRIRLSCAITELTPQSYRRQWSHGIHARCSTRGVTIVDHHVRSWRATLGRWQESMLTYVRHNYNEPQASLLNGILIGNTDGMPDRLNIAFQSTGTTHIVALSGFNVTIIMAIVVGWLVKVIGRRWAWLPALLMLIAFVIMSGASASVVRAAIMAIIVQAGLFIGRPLNMYRLLIYTILAMAWVNPLIVFHDLGFQLSFLATIGLVALAEPMASRLSAVSEKFGLRENLATTLSAITMTEPLLLWRFGRLSLVAPLVNIFVVPLIPLAMAIGAISLLGLWLPWITTIVVPASDALLRLIIFLITFGASLPQSMIQLAPIVTSLLGMIFIVIIILLIHRHAPKNTPA